MPPPQWGPFKTPGKKPVKTHKRYLGQEAPQNGRKKVKKGGGPTKGLLSTPNKENSPKEKNLSAQIPKGGRPIWPRKGCGGPKTVKVKHTQRKALKPKRP